MNSKLGFNNQTLMSDVLDRLISKMKPNDFLFEQDYTVKATFTDVSSKWQSVLKDCIWLDSTKFFKVYSNKFLDRVMQVMHRDMSD